MNPRERPDGEGCQGAALGERAARARKTFSFLQRHCVSGREEGGRLWILALVTEDRVLWQDVDM